MFTEYHIAMETFAISRLNLKKCETDDLFRISLPTTQFMTYDHEDEKYSNETWTDLDVKNNELILISSCRKCRSLSKTTADPGYHFQLAL
jgi:hypothetical protein